MFIQDFFCPEKKNKAICEHNPRLQAIQGYKRLHKTAQGNSYKRQTMQLFLLAKPYERSHTFDNCTCIYYDHVPERLFMAVKGYSRLLKAI